jgi:hypothetical protein
VRTLPPLFSRNVCFCWPRRCVRMQRAHHAGPGGRRGPLVAHSLPLPLPLSLPTKQRAAPFCGWGRLPFAWRSLAACALAPCLSQHNTEESSRALISRQRPSDCRQPHALGCLLRHARTQPSRLLFESTFSPHTPLYCTYSPPPPPSPSFTEARVSFFASRVHGTPFSKRAAHPPLSPACARPIPRNTHPFAFKQRIYKVNTHRRKWKMN